MIIYAVNIHTGGGKVLLDELIENQPFGKISAAFLDARYTLPAAAKLSVFTSRGKLWGRIQAELQLHRFLKENPSTEPVLFFGNIPPFFKPRNPGILYLQNCFLTRQVPLPRDSRKEMLRNWIESVLLKFFSRNIREVWVQTPWMKRMTERFLPRKQVLVKPFLPQFKIQPNSSVPRVYDFLYVGSLALNKRFLFFFDALKSIDSQLQKRIKVAIVLDHPVRALTEVHFKNIDISLNFQLSRNDLAQVFQQSKNLVIASLNESFGLPLYEAHHFGCQVIAPIAGYTEDLPFAVTHFQTQSKEDLVTKMLQAL